MSQTEMLTASFVFSGRNGAITRQYYAELEKLGPVGMVAMNLFRAQKCSTRAKQYRGGIRGVGSYKSMTYDRKGWSLQQLCDTLVKHGDELGIRFGWGRDSAQTFNSWVLYVDLPDIGQVSFHSPTRYAGPDYPGEWDRAHASEERILRFCDGVMKAPEAGELFRNADVEMEARR
jgi:hypothetical protein